MLAAVVLSALVGWAALSVAVRAKLDGRAETLVATLILASAFVLGPIYVLGVTGTLTRGTLTAFVLLVAAAAWAASSLGSGVRAQARATAAASAGILRMPLDALAESWRARSAVLACLAACLVLFAWNLLAAWLAPSWRQWDGLWYHESIVGFTIQNHGFAPVDLPSGGIQKINGYPRAGEMLSLWLAMYAGRALVDMPNVLLVPALFASVYAMTRRLTGDRVLACGWAAVVTTIPEYVELLQSAYVDPALAAFIAAGAMFVLRSPLRAREALLGAVALAIAANVKVSGVFPVVALAGIAAAALLAAPGRRLRTALLTIGAGAAIIVALSAATYLRNLRVYHNPVWPDLHVQVPSLGIDWPGNQPWGVVRSNSRSSSGVNKNAPLLEELRDLFLPPGALTDEERKYTYYYGLGVPWVLLPAAILVAARLLREVHRGWRGRDALERRRLLEVLGLLATAGVTLITSPNRLTPRYHVATLALWVPVIAWSVARRRVLQEAMAFAAMVGSLAIIAPEAPRWRGWPSPADLVALWKLDPPLREMTPELGGTVLRDTGVAREADLAPGTTVVSDDFVFPSVLWNNAYSNRVVYVRPSADLAAAADRLGATWIYANDKGAAEKLRGNPGWHELGPLYVERWGTAFRRAR
jgi:hypothetical protein